jgi:ribosome-associated protein YbcJ (S4-like RNA binding protein)
MGNLSKIVKKIDEPETEPKIMMMAEKFYVNKKTRKRRKVKIGNGDNRKVSMRVQRLIKRRNIINTPPKKKRKTGKYGKKIGLE